MTRKEQAFTGQAFTGKEKRLALIVVAAAAILTALSVIGIINTRPPLGAYDQTGGFSTPADVLDARPVNAG